MLLGRARIHVVCANYQLPCHFSRVSPQLDSYSTAVVHALRKHTTQVALRVRLELPEETARALIGSGD